MILGVVSKIINSPKQYFELFDSNKLLGKQTKKTPQNAILWGFCFANIFQG
jgi:hypothetical protein